MTRFSIAGFAMILTGYIGQSCELERDNAVLAAWTIWDYANTLFIIL